MRRLFDIALSGMALTALSPLLIPVAALLKVTGEGEVFYIQKRVGKNKEKFGLFKFVTMMKNSENMKNGTVTVKNDPRVLPVGRFLRKTKINELPQLLNIFKGDMSVIGPRPQTDRCFLAFPEDSQEAISKVKPGLSGIGSIVFRDEEEMLADPDIDRMKFYDEVIAPYKGELEQWYVKHQDSYTYFMLIGLTAWVIVFPKSEVYKRIFKDLPKVPKGLKKYL